MAGQGAQGSCASYQRCRRGLGRGSARPAARRQKACGQITMSQSGLHGYPLALVPKDSRTTRHAQPGQPQPG